MRSSQALVTKGRRAGGFGEYDRPCRRGNLEGVVVRLHAELIVEIDITTAFKANGYHRRLFSGMN